MKKVTRYEHKCKRCEKKFISSFEQPRFCAKCKSASWNIKPKPKKQDLEDEARVA